MTDPCGARILWKSRRGHSRAENRDVGALVNGSGFIVAMIADGYGLHAVGSEYPEAVLSMIAREIQCATDICIEDCVVAFRGAHESLRRQYAGQRFCFALLLLHKAKGESWVIHCGDCRVGTTDGPSSSWATEVHSVAVPCGETFDKSCIDDDRSHIVTRYVGMRSPSLAKMRIHAAPDATFVLATDGYWTRHMQGRLDEPAPDDSSFLYIGHDHDIVDSDCDNFTIYNG